MTSPFSPRSRIVLGIRLGIVRSLKAVMPASVRLHLWVLWRRLKRWPSVPVGSVDFGNLRRLVPINREFGFDRGQPVDRYYIENYLARHAEEIRGRVLEIGDNVYTRRFGGSRVAKSDVLHVSGDSPRATIVADLTNAGHVPGESFDCIIFTQTLQFIYDTRAALKTLCRVLKPGGVLLATCTGISHLSRYDMDRWGEYWHFTTRSTRLLLEEVFPASHVEVEAHGNVLSAIASLHGVAAGELLQEELDFHDPDFEVVITSRAVKPDGPPGPSASSAGISRLTKDCVCALSA